MSLLNSFGFRFTGWQSLSFISFSTWIYHNYFMFWPVRVVLVMPMPNWVGFSLIEWISYGSLQTWNFKIFAIWPIRAIFTHTWLSLIAINVCAKYGWFGLIDWPSSVRTVQKCKFWICAYHQPCKTQRFHTSWGTS